MSAMPSVTDPPTEEKLPMNLLTTLCTGSHIQSAHSSVLRVTVRHDGMALLGARYAKYLYNLESYPWEYNHKHETTKEKTAEK
jgi:hypothetical protein